MSIRMSYEQYLLWKNHAYIQKSVNFFLAGEGRAATFFSLGKRLSFLDETL